MGAPPPLPPLPASRAPRLVWSQTLPNRPRGLALAREKAWLLLWDKNHWLYLLNCLGVAQGQFLVPGVLSAACCAEDGSAFAAVGGSGEVWWLAPDLSLRWQAAVPGGAVAAALDPFGQYLAVSDDRGNLSIFDRLGRSVTRVTTPRPLHYLAFVPAAPRLVGAADFGLVACFDLSGGLQWRDALFHNAGALTVSGDGGLILLACYTEGLHRYTLDGKNRGRLPLPEPCYLAHLSFDGRFILAASLDGRLLLLDTDGQVRCVYPVDKPAVGVALAALANYAIAVLKDGQVLCLDLAEFAV